MIREFRSILPAYDSLFVLWSLAIITGIVLGLGPLLINEIDSGLIPIVFAAMVLPFVAFVVGSVEKILIAGIILEIPIQIDKSYLYNDEAAYYSALGGFNISLTTLCLILLYALWAARLLANQNRYDTQSHVSVMRPAPFIYVGIAAASILLANDKLLAIFEINLLLQAFLVMIYIAFNMRTRQDIEFMLIMAACALLMQSLIMIFLAVTKAPVQLGTITARIDEGKRVGGTVGSPNSTASYLTLVLAPMLGLLVTKVKRWYKPIVSIVFIFGLISILITFSRGGWIGFAMSIVILFIIGWQKGWIPLSIVIFTGFVFAGVAIGFQGVILDRIFGDDGNAAAGRVPLMVLAVDIIRDNAFLGVGVNNFSTVWDPYLGPELSGIWLHIVHNKYLLIWAETGIIGVLAFLAFLFTVLAQCWRVIQSEDPFLAPIGLGFFGAIVGQMIHMNFDLFTGRPQVQMLWLTAGIVAAMSAIVRRESNVATLHQKY